ncbi:MAG: Endonuclease/exonuclease/phosphatase [Oscillospiraceae bacterium]|nr:Endonuclease/exonuclease/phosphatase [Oscillospiraceae bacterium]
MEVVNTGDYIKVVSFNLRRDGIFSKKNRWDSRKKFIVDIIKNSDASIIGVQELLPCMKKDIGNLLCDYIIIGEGRDKDDTSEHSDIILKSEDITIDLFTTFWISKNPKRSGSRAFLTFFPRICTVVELTLKNSDKKIRVFNTHFDHISKIARNLGVNLILKTIDELNKVKPLPTILMGDFNAKPNSNTIKKLSLNLHDYDTIRMHDVFYHIPKSQLEKFTDFRNTYHGFSGKLKKDPIDYIFVSNEFEVVEANILRGSNKGIYPSDHYPISATLRLK